MKCDKIMSLHCICMYLKLYDYVSYSAYYQTIILFPWRFLVIVNLRHQTKGEADDVLI